MLDGDIASMNGHGLYDGKMCSFQKRRLRVFFDLDIGASMFEG